MSCKQMSKGRYFFLWLLCLLMCSCNQEVTAQEGTVIDLTPEFYGESNGQGDLEEEPPLCVVHVCGEVNTPGVVSLPKGSRIADALELAGGFTEKAATDVVNLAAFIEDGQQIVFPDKDTAEAEKEKKRLEDSGIINLNTATLEQLVSLPGIGESRARDILAYREKMGGFQAPEELMQVPGIKENTFRKIEDKIVAE